MQRPCTAGSPRTGGGGGESDRQGFISWAPGFLRYGPNHVCLFFQGDKFMTFDQSLKEFQRLRTAELAQPSRSERRKQVQRGPDTPPRLLSWPGNRTADLRCCSPRQPAACLRQGRWHVTATCAPSGNADTAPQTRLPSVQASEQRCSHGPCGRPVHLPWGQTQPASHRGLPSASNSRAPHEPAAGFSGTSADDAGSLKGHRSRALAAKSASKLFLRSGLGQEPNLIFRT